MPSDTRLLRKRSLEIYFQNFEELCALKIFGKEGFFQGYAREAHKICQTNTHIHKNISTYVYIYISKLTYL